MSASQGALRCLVPGGTCPPPGGLEVGFACGSVVAPNDNAKARLVFCLL